jgi:hypothetical protein
VQDGEHDVDGLTRPVGRDELAGARLDRELDGGAGRGHDLGHATGLAR